jgi:hypothetical protein
MGYSLRNWSDINKGQQIVREENLQDPIGNYSRNSAMSSNGGYKTQKGDPREHIRNNG